MADVTSDELSELAYPGLEGADVVLSDLTRVQQLSGSLMRFPRGLTRGQVTGLRTAVRLLDGDEVELDGGLTVDVQSDGIEDLLEALNPDAHAVCDGGLLWTIEDHVVEVGDQAVAYGPAALWAPRPRLANLAELQALRAEVGDPEIATVKAQLEPTDAAFRWVPRERAEEYVENARG